MLNHSRALRALCLLPLTMALCACAVGPDYVRPPVETPASYKEAGKAAGPWKPAEPRDLDARGPWWEAYGDPVLNGLVSQVEVSNQNIRYAEAQFRQARALVQESRAGYFPTAGASAAADRSQTGSARALNTYGLRLDAAWELDVWGRVRRLVESDEARSQAGAADVAAARLSAQSELVQDYFQLRVADALKDLYARTIEAYERSLRLTRNQYNAGIVTKSDVAQAETQLRSAQAQATDLDVQRGQLEHAIAVLIGKPPAELSIARGELAARLPAIPVGAPSELLERRPDVAAAERLAAAANAQIGVAQAAYFPSFTLGASAGYQASRLSDWFSVPSRFWSLGPELAATIFDGGLRTAQTRQAEAAFDAAAAQYRQTALAAFQEVEDQLLALTVLEKEHREQLLAVESAREAERLALNQYKAGTVTYLSVVVVQAATLNNERAAMTVLGRRLAASVGLVKALGGGWSATELAEISNAQAAENGAAVREGDSSMK